MEPIENGVDTQAECTLTLEEHIAGALTALQCFGFGLGCETEYRALKVIAETARLRFGFKEYDPLPEATKIAADVEAELEKRLQAEREQPEVMAYVSDNGQVH